MFLKKNSFINNTAHLEGGAFKWKEIEPNISDDNIFIDNKADYGQINAAFPFRIEMEFNNQYEIICLNNNNSHCYNRFTNIASGSPINFTITFTIKDIYNVTCSSLNDG